MHSKIQESSITKNKIIAYEANGENLDLFLRFVIENINPDPKEKRTKNWFTFSEKKGLLGGFSFFQKK